MNQSIRLHPWAQHMHLCYATSMHACYATSPYPLVLRFKKASVMIGRVTSRKSTT